jgi:glutathione-independent formaldehyde dehydrogenase
VYVAGAGPVGLAAAYSAQLLGAATVIVGDMNADRLRQAESFGCATADLSTGVALADIIADIVGEPLVDAAVDAVGFEARGHGRDAAEEPATVLNDVMTVARAGASLGIPGLYVTGDPGARDDAAKEGQIGVKLGLGWARSHTFVTGQCPVKRYNRQLMNLILADKAHIAQAVNATTISLDDAPRGYAEFDKGAAQKYVIDPHGMVAA